MVGCCCIHLLPHTAMLLRGSTVAQLVKLLPYSSSDLVQSWPVVLPVWKLCIARISTWISIRWCNFPIHPKNLWIGQLNNIEQVTSASPLEFSSCIHIWSKTGMTTRTSCRLLAGESCSTVWTVSITWIIRVELKGLMGWIWLWFGYI